MADEVKNDAEQFTMPMAVAIVGMILVLAGGLLANSYLQILAAQVVMGCK